MSLGMRSVRTQHSDMAASGQRSPGRARYVFDRYKASLSYAIMLDRVGIPHQSVAGLIGRDRTAVDDPQRLLEDLVRPIDIFQEMTGWRRGEQMRADLREQVR